MTKIMTATKMTDGQIENAVSKLRDAMRKHRAEITSDVAQQVLGVENLGMMMFAPFRVHAEMVSNLIIRHVAVSRTRAPIEAINATGCNKYLNDSVVATMPQGSVEEVDVFFFKLDRYISDDDLDKEYELRGLKPADPYALAAANEADPAFADEHPNSTHWKDTNGNWCYAAFRRWRVERRVDVDRSGDGGGGWRGRWLFAGCRK